MSSILPSQLSVSNPAEVPALLVRADLAYWLSAVDAIAAGAAGPGTRSVSDFTIDRPETGRVYWETDDDDGDDDMEADLDDSDAGRALERSWEELADAVGRLADPRLRLTDDQRAALQEEANRAWADAEPLAQALEDALAAREKSTRALRELEMHKPGTVSVDRATRQNRDAQATARDLLSKVIGHGLQRRHGLYLRQDDDRVLRQLRALGGREPAGIAACVCGLVFTPRRTATKCERCHANPRTPALGVEGLDRGGYVFYSPALTSRTHVCEVCGGFFNPEKASALTCSLYCDRARRRERARWRRAAAA